MLTDTLFCPIIDLVLAEHKSNTNLLILTVGQNPVLLLRVKEHAMDVEVQPVFLIGSSFVRTDQQAALNLRIRKQHNLYR